MQITRKEDLNVAIVKVMLCCFSPLWGEGAIFALFRLIKEINLTEGHDEIIDALDKRFSFPGAKKWAFQISEAKRVLLRQKEAAGKQSEKKKKQRINLNDLQQEVEKLLVFLKDRNPDLSRWRVLNSALKCNFYW